MFEFSCFLTGLSCFDGVQVLTFIYSFSSTTIKNCLVGLFIHSLKNQNQTKVQIKVLVVLEKMPITCKCLHQVKEKTSLAVTSHHLFKGCWWARAIVNTFVLYRYTLWKEKKNNPASWRMRSSYFKTIPCGCSGKSWLDAICNIEHAYKASMSAGSECLPFYCYPNKTIPHYRITKKK